MSPAAAVATTPGRLVLVPNALDHGTGVMVDLRAVLPDAVIARAATIEHWTVENAKTARAFLKRIDAVRPLRTPLQSLVITELPRATKGRADEGAAAAWHALLDPVRAGHEVGLLSEAGLPALADPGALLVAAAHREAMPVDVLGGGSAVALALAASGLNGQSFAFVGYLPQRDPERSDRIRALESRSAREQQTQVAIEAPYRNAALFDALIRALAPQTRLAIACGLTLPHGWNRTQAVAQWRAAVARFDADVPAVFSWLA